jgi:glutamyl/glutaminyl-tRNA synthetase
MGERLKKLPVSMQWDAERMNMTCSEYLHEMKTFNNEDVFYLIRYALTGNPVGAPIGEIAEVVGRKEVENRIADAVLVF